MAHARVLAAPVLPLAVRKELDVLCDRFERALRRGEPAAVEDFLGQAPEAARLDLLAQLAAAELEHRLAGGEAVRAEQFFARYPQLLERGDLAVGLLAEEFD